MASIAAGLKYFPIKFLPMIEGNYDHQAPGALEWYGHNAVFVNLEGLDYIWTFEQFGPMVLAIHVIEDGAEEMDYE